MNFDKLNIYLVDKGKNRTQLESITLKALDDNDFINDFINFDFIKHQPHLNQILGNPQLIKTNVTYEERYNQLLSLISNTFTVYLYDKKGKYTQLKSKIDTIEERINDANIDIKKIRETSNLVKGAEILEGYAKEFKKRSEAYDEEANKWKKGLFISFGCFGLTFIGLLFINILNLEWLSKYIAEDLIFYGYISAIIIKAIIIITVIQIIRFCFRNYNANKHLSQQSLHKYDVLRSLRGVYNTIDDKNTQARDDLIKTGAIVAFQNIESGYITTKEGAGNTDSGLSSLISSIISKK